MISAVGEHAECELKREWRRDTPYLRAEFIKDIQSIANSDIPAGRDKYIVVGVDESTRAYTGCDHSDYDDASIRQLLAAHLDRVPEFELLRPVAPNGKPIVAVRIPKQAQRPFIATKTIADQSGKKVYLQEGEIWYKPGGPTTGGTGKQRVTTREAFIAMLDLDSLVHNLATERINQMLPTIRLEERTRLLGASGVIPVATATDDEFEAYVKQALVSNNESIFNILLEEIRDKTVGLWEEKSQSLAALAPPEMRELKEYEFLPSMRRLLHLGLLLIKFSAAIPLFARVANQLFEILTASYTLQGLMAEERREENPADLADHTNYSVPAIESLIAAHLLMGFSLRKAGDTRYASTLFPKVARYGRSYESDRRRLFLNWPYYWEGAPKTDIDLLTLERFGGGDRIARIVGGQPDVQTLVLQADCLLEWHSFLSFLKLGKRTAGEPAIVDYYASTYPPNALRREPCFYRERLERVFSILRLIAMALDTGQESLIALDDGLAKVMHGIDRDRRLVMLGNFMIYAHGEQSSRMFQSNRWPYDVSWPDDLKAIMDSARTANSEK